MEKQEGKKFNINEDKNLLLIKNTNNLSVYRDPEINNQDLNDKLDLLVNINNHKYIIDHIIENFHFSRFHLATLFVCLFSLMADGFLNYQMSIASTLLKTKYQWQETDVNVLYSFQMIFMAIGAFVSTTSRSIHWDISSNFLIGTIGCLSIILIVFYSDPFVYTILLLTFCVCQGFIENICTNYLLELTKKKIRGFLFLLVSSFKLFGIAANAFLFSFLFGEYQVDDPSLVLIGLAGAQFFLTVSLIYFLDSPRVLFHNNELSRFYEFIQEITTEGKQNIYNQHLKTEVISKLDVARKEIEYNYGVQKNEGLFITYTYLFKKPHIGLTIKAIVLIFLTIVFLTNVNNSHEEFYIYSNMKNLDIFSISNVVTITPKGERVTKYSQFFYYFTQFLVGILLSFAYLLLPKVKRIYFNLTALIISLIFLSLVVFIRQYFSYFFVFFDAFASFYYFLIYLYLSENTTTKLRNSLTSTMYIVAALTYIIQYFSVKTLANFNPFILLYLNYLIAIFLILMEFLAIDNSVDVKDLNLQEIEINILKEGK